MVATVKRGAQTSRTPAAAPEAAGGASSYAGSDHAAPKIRAPGLAGPPAPHVGGEPATRGRIRAAARLLFERKGYTKTSVGEIAEACAMSPANLYRHYRNKQAIGQAVIHDFVAEQAAEVQAALDAPAATAEARLRATLTAQIFFTVRHLREAPRLVELADMIFASEDGLSLITRMEQEDHAMKAALVEAGVAAGEFTLDGAFPDRDAAARAMKNCLLFFNSPFGLVRRGLATVETDVALALDLICAGLKQGARRAD